MRVGRRGQTRDRRDDLNAERAEHAESFNERSAVSASFALNRSLRPPPPPRACGAEAAVDSVPEETRPVWCQWIDAVLARGTNNVRPGAGSLEALQGECVLFDRGTETSHRDGPASTRRLYHVEP